MGIQLLGKTEWICIGIQILGQTEWISIGNSNSRSNRMDLYKNTNSMSKCDVNLFIYQKCNFAPVWDFSSALHFTFARERRQSRE